MGDSFLGGFHLNLENPKAAVPSTVDAGLAGLAQRFLTSYRNETIWFYSTVLGNDASAGVCSAYDTTLLEQGASARDDPILKGLSWQYHAISKPSWLVIADSI